MRLYDRPINTDSRTLEGIRNILTVTNKVKLATAGPCTPGTEVRCLRTNGSGYYMPCMAFIVSVTPSGRFTVDLWKDRSERVTVTAKAILWSSTGKEGTSDEPAIADGFYSCSFCPCRYPESAQLGQHNKLAHEGARV